jgi:hypothetical protein
MMPSLRRIASILGTYMVRVGTTLKDYGKTVETLYPPYPKLDLFEKTQAVQRGCSAANAYMRRTRMPHHVAEFMVNSYLEGLRFVS